MNLLPVTLKSIVTSLCKRIARLSYLLAEQTALIFYVFLLMLFPMSLLLLLLCLIRNSHHFLFGLKLFKSGKAFQGVLPAASSRLLFISFFINTKFLHFFYDFLYFFFFFVEVVKWVAWVIFGWLRVITKSACG